jgi:hypothetical protein
MGNFCYPKELWYNDFQYFDKTNLSKKTGFFLYTKTGKVLHSTEKNTGKLKRLHEVKKNALSSPKIL